MLSVERIKYSVSGKTILDDVSFKVEGGEIFALLGHNGAGKTSLFEIITDIIHPESGKILIKENNTFSQCKRDVGVLWDNITIFPWLKVKEVIKYVLSMYDISTFPQEIYNHLGINSIEDSFMNKLSRGEKRKVELFLTTIHNPILLVLDEPTSSLDPMIRNYVWDNVIRGNNKTVLFSTHQWDEALKYADRVAFIYKGRILNKPASGNALILDSHLTTKIAVNNSIEIDGVTAFSYESQSITYYLIHEKDNVTLNKIKSCTMNYTILPIDLEDLYYYLIWSLK